MLYGIGATLPANSFALPGSVRWQALDGDWWDAAKIYERFVKSPHGIRGLPAAGRPDTDKTLRDLPFWICDYIPNSAYQGDNKPKTLSAGSDLYEPDYWVDAAIALQKELGTPIGYHIYNWHEIPFNLEYPHFLPAKRCFLEGLAKLHEHPIYVMPYINGVSWEQHDDIEGHAVNFANTGCRGACITENGEYRCQKYPQVKPDGTASRLIQMCPSSRRWREIIGELAGALEQIGVDGIYFDQISATSADACYSREHGHLPGGGTHWRDGYFEMMEEIRAKRGRPWFAFTEDNNEVFLGCFDGMLTWCWVRDRDVPAFPAVYAGLSEMIERTTNGRKKEDKPYFRMMTAKSLLYGQSIGWCKADVLYDAERLSFLKAAVQTRWAHNAFFTDGSILRPPCVTAEQPETLSEPNVHFGEWVHIESACAGAWKNAAGDTVLLMACNISEKPNRVSLTFRQDEYRLARGDLPEGMTVDGTVGRYETVLAPFEVRALTLPVA